VRQRTKPNPTLCTETKGNDMTKTTKTTTKRDIYEEVTNTIIESLETCGEWSRPWTNLGLDASAPRSINGRPYRGMNTVLLWWSAMTNNYTSGVWGTYKSWQAHGAQVRKGEKGTLVVLWKPFDRKATAAEIASGDDKNKRGLLLRHFTVFNAAQVDGYEMPELPTGPDALEHADAFFTSIGADVDFGGDDAYYSPGVDRIAMPMLNAFKSADDFYATMAHEHAHWTGHKSRLDRDFSGRFGTDAYAFEELVAELTSAFVGAHLGIGTSVRENHAAYVKNWLRVLRNDKKAVFTAASQAQKACDFLTSAAGETASAEEELIAA